MKKLFIFVLLLFSVIGYSQSVKMQFYNKSTGSGKPDVTVKITYDKFDKISATQFQEALDNLIDNIHFENYADSKSFWLYIVKEIFHYQLFQYGYTMGLENIIHLANAWMNVKYGDTDKMILTIKRI